MPMPMPQPEASSRPSLIKVSYVLILRVTFHHTHVVSNGNNVGLFSCTLMIPTQFYLFEIFVDVMHDENGITMALEDNYGDNYNIVHR